MLSNDICRCVDHRCPKASTCLRYTDLMENDFPMSFTSTLRDDINSSHCDYYIEDLSEKEKHRATTKTRPASPRSPEALRPSGRKERDRKDAGKDT